jgi:hypothetical protein
MFSFVLRYCVYLHDVSPRNLGSREGQMLRRLPQVFPVVWFIASIDFTKGVEITLLVIFERVAAHTHTHTRTHTHRQTDRQTDRQTHTHTQTQAHTHLFLPTPQQFIAGGFCVVVVLLLFCVCDLSLLDFIGPRIVSIGETFLVVTHCHERQFTPSTRVNAGNHKPF